MNTGRLSALLFASLLSVFAQDEGAFDPGVTQKAQSRPDADKKVEPVLRAPLLVVTPAFMDFGTVSTNTAVTNTFLVENAGGGRLVGTASVRAPFRILEGGKYSLRPRELQVVTIAYSPTRYSAISNDVQLVTFTGGNGFTVKVAGRPGLGSAN